MQTVHDSILFDCRGACFIEGASHVFTSRRAHYVSFHRLLFTCHEANSLIIHLPIK